MRSNVVAATGAVLFVARVLVGAIFGVNGTGPIAGKRFAFLQGAAIGKGTLLSLIQSFVMK